MYIKILDTIIDVYEAQAVKIVPNGKNANYIEVYLEDRKDPIIVATGLTTKIAQKLLEEIYDQIRRREEKHFGW